MLPVRRTRVASDEVEALAAAQPERGRSYVQMRGGAFQGRLSERSDGTVAVQRESWSSPLRVRCARPVSYVAFSVVSATDGATWCGVSLGPQSLIQVDRDWELTSRGRLESRSFAVRREALEDVELQLAGGSPEALSLVNRVLPQPAARLMVGEFRRRVQDALSVGALPPEAQNALRAEFLRLAALLRRWGRVDGTLPESYSRRRAAVRKVEEYLDAHERALPSIADLCAVAEVSERTLEYAFREQIGLAPARYLRLRRLNGVQRDLRAVRPGDVKVTEVAMRWGFWQLGRFAGEYRAVFGERPSQTRAALRSQRRGAPASPETTGIVSASS
jgi:AraC family ethanolamine operon transcriptional activator